MKNVFKGLENVQFYLYRQVISRSVRNVKHWSRKLQGVII